MSSRTRIVLLWLLLVVVTLSSLSLFEVFQFSDAVHYVGLVSIGLAFIKVRFIGLDFMELRHSPFPMRLAFEVWVVVAGVALMVLYSLQTLVRG